MSKTINHSVQVAIAVNPQALSAGAANGSAVDRKDFRDGRLVVQGGAASGSPTAQSIAGKVQESDDGSTGWVDVTGAAITAIAADNGIADVAIPDMHKRKRYLRAVLTVSFTGGSSPAVPASALFELGDKTQNPVN